MKFARSLTLCLGALSLLPSSPTALPTQEQAPSASATPIVIGEQLELASVQLNEPRQLRVAVPPHYDQTNATCCVLYLLDGESLFEQAVGLVRHLGEFDAPPILIVGIDNTERTRDLTPPATDPDTTSSFPTGGGSATFRRYLVDEVKPFVEARYRTNGIDLLAGHSFGGLFAAETLLLEPEAFDGFLALSPSFWWNDASLVADFEDLAPEHGLYRRFAWFSIGDEGAGMNPHFEAVVWSLRDNAPARFRWQSGHFAGHDHWSAAVPGLNEGLRAFFEPLRSFAQDARTFEDVERGFAAVREAYGETFPMTAGPIVRRARELKEEESYAAAVALLDGTMQHLPDEPLLSYVRSEVLTAAGRFEEAATTLEAAIDRFAKEPRHAMPVAWLRRQLRDLRSQRTPKE